MSPISAPGQSRVDAFNALIRGACLIILLGVFAFVFVWGQLHGNPLIGSDAFLSVLSTIVVWYFKSRDDKATTDAVTAAALAPAPGQQPAVPPAPPTPIPPAGHPAGT